MANVKFLRGTQTALSNLQPSSIEDGTLYFAINNTTLGADQRGKLYLGDANHNLIPIGEDIILKAVANMEALPSAANHLGEFYYISSDNILAFSKIVESQPKWVQVNNDTKLVANAAALTSSFDGTNNTASVALAVNDTSRQPGNESNIVSGSFTLKGGNNVTISSDSGSIKFDAVDTTYGLGSSAGTKNLTINGDAVTVTTAKLDLTSSKANDNSSVEIYSPGNTVTVNRANDGTITLDVNASRTNGLSSFVQAPGQLNAQGESSGSTYGFSSLITASDGTKFPANIDPLIQIKDATGSYMSGVHFNSGTAQLDVFSTTAVNTLINNAKANMNAMTYIGPASTMADIEGTQANPRELHNGDVFLADETISFAGKDVAGDVTSAEPGYLIIVGGTETNGVIPTADVEYTIIKANDTDTTYSLVTTGSHSIVLQNNHASDNIVGSLTLAAGSSNAITLTDSSGSNNAKTITIEHANLRAANWQTTGTAQTINGDTVTSFTAVTGVTVDEQGHVSAVQTSTLTPLNTITHINDVAFTVSSGGTNIVKVRNTVSDDQETSDYDEFSIASTGGTIAVTVGSAAKTVNVDLVWGTF